MTECGFVYMCMNVCRLGYGASVGNQNWLYLSWMKNWLTVDRRQGVSYTEDGL